MRVETQNAFTRNKRHLRQPDDTPLAEWVASETLALPNRKAWAEMCRLLALLPKGAFQPEIKAAWARRKKLQRKRRRPSRVVATLATADLETSLL
jgi:hypothetical protein